MVKLRFPEVNEFVGALAEYILSKMLQMKQAHSFVIGHIWLCQWTQLTL